MLSITQVANRLNVSRQMVHKLIVKGKLKAYRVGNLWRIFEKDLDKYLEEK